MSTVNDDGELRDKIWHIFRVAAPHSAVTREMIDEDIDHIMGLIHQRDEARDDYLRQRIGFMRQWLNEDRITDDDSLVTNEQLEHWLFTNPEKSNE